MNNERRKRIKKAATKLEMAVSMLESYKTDIEEICSEEEDSYDNLPESFQDGLKGSDMQEAIDAMTDVVEMVDDIIDNIEKLQTELIIL